MDPSPASKRPVTFGLIIAALGVVYGDIGTSPLYAFRLCFNGTNALPASPENVLGLLSLIFWLLIILITLKYLSFVLRADNNGEGGILALMTLLTKATKTPMLKRGGILLLGLFGAALMYGDGLITPAISVLSAVEGLTSVTPALTPFILPVSIGILFFLFWFQKHGSNAIGKIFGPIMLLWFATIALLGIFSIIKNPMVLVAIDPCYAVPFFVHNKIHGFLALGTIFLVLTGGEALYADMGHFGKGPIKRGWFYIVFPALIFNYFGQGAFLLRNPNQASNLFFQMGPQWLTFPLVVLATAATVIASQAVISGVFSLTRQAVQLGYFPRLVITHTSKTTIGQVYVPVFNWLLCIGTILLILGFKKSDNLAGAYGVAVSTTMLITTFFLSLVMTKIWKWNTLTSMFLCGIFFIIDFVFFCANILKIKDGGWVSISIAFAMIFLMLTWDDGRRLLREHITNAALAMQAFLADVIAMKPTRVAGTAVFLAGNPTGVPRTLLHNYKHNKVLHTNVVIVTVVTLEIPYVNEADRLSVTNLGSGFYWITAQFGFSETPDIPKTLESASVKGLSFDQMQTTYFLGRETLITTKRNSKMMFWQKGVFSFLSRNACDASNFFHIPPNRVIEIGIQIEL